VQGIQGVWGKDKRGIEVFECFRGPPRLQKQRPAVVVNGEGRVGRAVGEDDGGIGRDCSTRFARPKQLDVCVCV